MVKKDKQPKAAAPAPVEDHGTESTRYRGVWFYKEKWWFEDGLTGQFQGPYINEEAAHDAQGRYTP